ncbi:hypothetical protein CH296_27850 [Rhodococcus sp. 14-2496-1d]|uniref:hypothetical protein n=1 Tax=Rhodococcus sp. 14-2496-1d TaxID=2023146 RepID=UPI000B9B4FAD|nr:hypothetical protein [Rhodococcus sp. 14-2496-1d]OZF25351.1 hypothetical protein CH296_27850 [Rhodococcus sp. 14-2496-1d]
MSAQEIVAAALAKHADAGSRLVEIDPPEGPAEMDAYRFRVSCRCGWFALVPVDQTKRSEGERNFADVHADHQASVVAELPDVALVELPKPEPDHNGERYYDGVSYRVSADGAFHKRALIDGVWEWALASPRRVKNHAAELLAAAHAAEEQQ